MPKSTPFRLNRSGMLLALISAAFAGNAGAAAGRVDFVAGGVTVSGTDGRTQPLSRGAELDTGDTVRTTDGRAQIRFTDGSYVSLQPNTEFSIKDYRFEGKTDGTESGLFALARGAMRTVTGLIGRVNRNRYRITTPTATVGIRGTGGVIQVLNDGSTLVIGTSGIWSLSNPSGSIDVPAGVSGLAPSAPDSPPQQTNQQPTTIPMPIQQAAFVQGDQRTETGEPTGITTFTPLISGSGYTSAIAYADGSFGEIAGGDGGEGGNAFSNATAVFNSAGQLTELTDDVGGSIFTLAPGGTHGLRPDGSTDFKTDGILAWGRWVGPVAFTAFEGTVNYGPEDGFHYVIGMPTPVMPTSGTATYSLLGATSPTVAGGNGGGLGTVTSGSLNVGFNSGSYTVGLVNFGVSMPGASYRLDGSTQVNSASSGWQMFPDVVATGGSACSGGCGCFAQANGFFAGANAERAGMSYRIGDSGGQGTKYIIGGAAFKKD